MGQGIIAYVGNTIYLDPDSIGTVNPFFNFFTSQVANNIPATPKTSVTTTQGKVLKSGVKDDPRVSAAVTYMNAEISALQGAGFNDDQVKFNIVKDWMESAGYTSTGSKVNNPGNIMFGKNNINATKGPYLAGNKTYLAAYRSLADYAVDLRRVLMMKPGQPFLATGYPDLTGFVHRLKLNNYYGKESETSYLAKMKGSQQRLRIIQNLQDDTHQDVVVPAGDKFTEWWNNLSMVEKVGVGVAAFTVVAILVKR